MDTLVFRLQFLLTSLYRTFTDESTHMPRIPKKTEPAETGSVYNHADRGKVLFRLLFFSGRIQ